MYHFQFVRIINGKTKPELFRSVQSAHTAMGIYAGKHDLNIDVHQDRWREDARSIMYKGDNPILGTVGYVAQIGPSSPQPEPKNEGSTEARRAEQRVRKDKIKADKMSRMPVIKRGKNKNQ